MATSVPYITQASDQAANAGMGQTSHRRGAHGSCKPELTGGVEITAHSVAHSHAAEGME
jgi:hypothetical protein